MLVRSHRAFTLIEMSLVVALLFLAAALVTPNLVAMRQSRKAADMRASIIRLPVQARNEAVKLGATIRLRTEEKSLVLERVTNTGGSGELASSQPTEENTEVRRLDLRDDWEVSGVWTNGQQAGTEDWQWDVSPDGSATSAAIQFRENGATHSLTLLPDGQATWSDGDPIYVQDEEWTAGELETRG